MEKIIYYPVFFTATIRHWKRLLKPDKYEEIILEQFSALVGNHRGKQAHGFNHGSMPIV